MPDTPEQPQEQQGLFGGIPAPLLMIGSLLIGLLLFFPNLLQGLFGMIGNLFGGNKDSADTAKDTGTTQPEQNQNPLASLLGMFTGQDKQKNYQPMSTTTTESAPSVPAQLAVKAALHGANAATGKSFTNDPSKPQWCSVDASGKPVAGNMVHTLGDTASTTKMLSAYLVASDTKLPKNFAQTEPAKGYISKMASDSDNASADKLLQLVAKQSGRSVEQVIGDYNKRLDAMGFKQTEIANFSGLPTAGDGGLFVAGFRNVSTAYESAVLTQQFGSQHQAVAALFAPRNNHTGLDGVSAAAVKSGTAFGVVNTGNGADKAATAYNGANGSVAVFESTRAQWIPTIEKALATLKGRGNLPVDTKPSAVMPPLPTGQTPPASSIPVQTI